MNKEDQNIQTLLAGLLEISTKEEAFNFLRDLLTEDEMEEFGKRFRAAKLLRDNVPYSQIVKETGLSSTTVARVSKWLHHGMHGYKTILDRLEKSA